MGDPFFDLGNFAVNHELDASGEAALLTTYDGGELRSSRLARLRLMRLVSDFREAMWGVLQQGISSLDVDFRAYAAEHFDRLIGEASTPEFEALLRDAAGT
jgi:thiamine kinase-like enzyme